MGMNKIRFLIFAVYVGLQSFLLQFMDQLIGTHLVSGGTKGFVFIAFQGWALYFLLGSKVKGAIIGFFGYLLGIIFAMVMAEISAVFQNLGILAVPITALIVVPVMMYFEYAPWFISNVATFFVGAGAFYAIYSYVDEVSMPEAGGIVMLYCTLGLLSGWMTILFRKWYEKKCVIGENRR